MFDFVDNCRVFLPKAIKGDLSPDELATWEEHLRCCQPCAQRFETFQQFVATLQQTPAPHLSADFEARLLQRIHARDTAPLLPDRARWLLHAYWIAAGLTGIHISTKLAWPGTMPAAAWLVFIALGIGMIVPVMAWIRSQRNLLDFGLKSVGLRQPADK